MRIEITEELLTHLYEAQKERLIYVLQHNSNGDDGGDYINSALDCFSTIQAATQDQEDTVAIDKWLNTPLDPDAECVYVDDLQFMTALGNLASDSIAQAFHDLDCPALPKDA